MTDRLFVSGTSKRHKRGVVFSCARHTRAFPGNSTFLLSQPSQKLLQRGYFSLGKSTQKQWTSDTGSLMMLKVVRKSSVINWHTATCSVLCEGCEREKTKIPVTRAREEASNEVVLDFYTLHPIQIHQLSFSPHQASEKKLPTTRKLRWRFPQKRWTFFQKTPTFFCFSPTFFHFSRRKTKKIATFSNGKKQGLMSFH